MRPPDPTSRLACAAALLLVGAAGCGEPAPLGPARLSLLAVGDTGTPPDDAKQYRRQLDVAAAMELNDRARPVQALILLGDQFYPDGLRADELVARVRANVVRPFCRFLEISGPRAREVVEACELPSAERLPLPVYAILGNHDYHSPESPRLQREVLPRFVSNWHMAEGAAEVFELDEGVSLVAFDSTPVFEGGDVAPLATALRASRGPWRLLAAHHPIADRDRGTEAQRHERYRRVVGEAVAAAGVTVHLVLSGHEHNLQLLTLPLPAPALHVITGGGAAARSLHGADPRRRAGFDEPGFARVDLVGDPTAGARLVASLYRLPPFPANLLRDAPQLAARWSVDRAGRVAEEP